MMYYSLFFVFTLLYPSSSSDVAKTVLYPYSPVYLFFFFWISKTMPKFSFKIALHTTTTPTHPVLHPLFHFPPRSEESFRSERMNRGNPITMYLFVWMCMYCPNVCYVFSFCSFSSFPIDCVASCTRSCLGQKPPTVPTKSHRDIYTCSVVDVVMEIYQCGKW